MIKKFLSFLLIASSGVIMVSCGNNDEGDNASSIMNGSSQNNASSQNVASSQNNNSSKAEETYTKVQSTVYMVGDSTMCNYDSLDQYYYPRYGYGTQMGNYFDTDYLTFNNLALSGRSSYSFLSEANYNTLKNNIKSGDYLIIGWGHNDEKYNTPTFRNANYESLELALADEDSFQSSIYKNYIELALDKGAYPILASPIVRLSSTNDYSKNNGHNYTDSSSGVFCGDYRKAIEDLAKEFDLPFIDLTTITKNDYTSLTFNNAIKYHAIYSGTDESSGALPNYEAYDGTHINYYGANMVAYEFANALKDTDSNLKYYVKDNITKPTEDILEKYDGYVWTNYEAPNLSSYSPSAAFQTSTEGWYGTAFGNMGGNSTSPFTAKETSTGVFTVGSNNSGKGKFESAGDGFAFLFKQIEANRNFKLTAKLTITAAPTTKQGGFGIMLRDDCYINVTEKANITTNFAAGGFLVNNSENGGNALFSRYNGKLSTVSNSAISGLPAINTEINVSLEKNGQNTIIEIEYSDKKYTYTFTDYSFDSKDTNYMYAGFFANRGIEIKVENINFTDNGVNTGA